MKSTSITDKIRKLIKKDNKQLPLENDKTIFKYLTAEDNNIISEYNELELEDLLLYLDSYYLELRDSIGFDDRNTFGIEIEFENAKIGRIMTALEKEESLNKWTLVPDSSLSLGSELVSPILTDRKKNWTQIEKACSILEENAEIKSTAAGHFHIGSHVLGKDAKSWLRLCKIWSVYEDIIYRFSYGEYLSERARLEMYAKPLSSILTEELKEFEKIHFITPEEIVAHLNSERNQAINFMNVKTFQLMQDRSTLEFRYPNGTLNPIIWQNNINLVLKVLEYCKSDRYNQDIIEKRQKEEQYIPKKIEEYRKINLEKALEFTDLIFEKNIDKVYFLRQYLKSFKESTNKFEKAKVFTYKQ